MNGERWTPSPAVRAYQEARMIVPVVMAGVSTLAKKVHISLAAPQIHNYAGHSQTTAFLAAQHQGDTATARSLAAATFMHGFRENSPDSANWQGVWQAMRAVANPENGAYMDSLALTAGGAVPTVKGPNAGSSGILDTLSGLFQRITQPTADAAAVKAGQATASSLTGTVVIVGAGVLAVVLVVLFVRRR